MENNGNRFHLNLNNNNDRPQLNDRAYPTTPSTFPNPIFPPQAQGGQQWQGQNAQQQQYPASNAPQGYFMSNPYPPQYPQQPPASTYPQAPQAPQASYQQRPAAAYQGNDATNGLVHQFSHQNLGGRASPYGAARPAQQSSQRPRTAGAPAQQGYNNYLSAPMPNQPAAHVPEFERAPERNSDKYPAAHTNQTRCAQLSEGFFKDSVKRARDRNVR